MFKWTFFYFHLLPLDKWDWCKTGTLNVQPWAITVIVNWRFFNKLYYDVKKKVTEHWKSATFIPIILCEMGIQWYNTQYIYLQCLVIIKWKTCMWWTTYDIPMWNNVLWWRPFWTSDPHKWNFIRIFHVLVLRRNVLLVFS